MCTKRVSSTTQNCLNPKSVIIFFSTQCLFIRTFFKISNQLLFPFKQSSAYIVITRRITQPAPIVPQCRALVGGHGTKSAGSCGNVPLCNTCGHQRARTSQMLSRRYCIENMVLRRTPAISTVMGQPPCTLYAEFTGPRLQKACPVAC